MLYEIRTYEVKPLFMRELLGAFGEALEKRTAPGRPIGCWSTDIGPASQFIHMWAWRDLNERAEIRAGAAKDPNWPPKIDEFLAGPMRSEIFVPYAFSPEIKPGKYGRLYEMRSYILPPGGIQKIAENWPKRLGERVKYSPLLAAMHSDIGELNQFVHIWPYDSLDARAEVRAKSLADGAWPPPGSKGGVARMDVKIMIPAPFSQLQ